MLSRAPACGTINKVPMHMMLPRFAQSLGGHSLALLSRWGMLPHFAQSLGECSLASLSRWGMLPCFAQSLGGRSLTLLSHWGDTPLLRSVTGGTSLTSLSRFPFKGSIKLLQNLRSRGSMKQHFTFGSLIVGTSIR